MTARVVAPVVPSRGLGTLAGPVRGARRLPVSALPPVRAGGVVCGVAAVDCNGRVVDRVVLGALGWVPGVRLDIRATDGLIAITVSDRGGSVVSRPGQLRLPAPVRHWCGLDAGSRVLLAAHRGDELLVVYPPAALEALLSVEGAALRGGEAT